MNMGMMIFKTLLLYNTGYVLGLSLFRDISEIKEIFPAGLIKTRVHFLYGFFIKCLARAYQIPIHLIGFQLLAKALALLSEWSGRPT